jgi:hypothetical protein
MIELRGKWRVIIASPFTSHRFSSRFDGRPAQVSWLVRLPPRRNETKRNHDDEDEPLDLLSFAKTKGALSVVSISQEYHHRPKPKGSPSNR